MVLSRFAADLPPVREYVTLGEGDTPVLPLDVLAEQLGVDRIWAKMESQNPTGSYKDRVAAMSLSLARDHGNQGWISSSSGNAGLAMAAYGARAALPGFLCLVSSAPMEKRVPLAPYGVEIVGIDGIGDGATTERITGLMDQIRSAALRHDLYLGITAHAFNHEGMRGVDTIAYELGEQVPATSHVYVPAGGGGLLVAIARGLGHRGLPARVVACQPSGCAPIVGVLEGVHNAVAVEQCTSGISGLQVPSPPDGSSAVEAVRISGGWGVSVSDEEILHAQRRLAEAEGIFVEPAAATALAALVRDVDTGRIGRTDHPVLLLSGAGWKDLGRFVPEADMPRIEYPGIGGRVDDWAGRLVRAPEVQP